MQGFNREPETQQNARPFGSSMAEGQRFGWVDREAVNKHCLYGSQLLQKALLHHSHQPRSYVISCVP